MASKGAKGRGNPCSHGHSTHYHGELSNNYLVKTTVRKQHDHLATNEKKLQLNAKLQNVKYQATTPKPKI